MSEFLVTPEDVIAASGRLSVIGGGVEELCGHLQSCAGAAAGTPAEAVRAGRVGKLALERIDGEPAIASPLAQELIALGFHSGPRKLTLSA